MIFQHPTTKHKTRVKRTNYELRAHLIRTGYVDVTPPPSARKQQCSEAFVKLGTVSRTKACLRMVQHQCSGMLTQADICRLRSAESLMTSLQHQLNQTFKRPST